MKNLTAFKALIVLYKSITLKDIDKSAEKFPFTTNTSETVANDLTGFGSHISCILCRGIDCKDCVYNSINNDKFKLDNMCYRRDNRSTYYGINNAPGRITLKRAFKARAKHMETLLLLLNK